MKNSRPLPLGSSGRGRHDRVNDLSYPLSSMDIRPVGTNYRTVTCGTLGTSRLSFFVRTGGIPRVRAVVKRQKSPHTAASFFVMPRDGTSTVSPLPPGRTPETPHGYTHGSVAELAHATRIGFTALPVSSLLKLTHHTQSRYVDLLQIGSFGPPSCMCPRELTRSRGDPEERHTDSQSHLPPQRTGRRGWLMVLTASTTLTQKCYRCNMASRRAPWMTTQTSDPRVAR